MKFPSKSIIIILKSCWLIEYKKKINIFLEKDKLDQLDVSEHLY